MASEHDPVMLPQRLVNDKGHPRSVAAAQEALSNDFILYQEINGATYVPPPEGGYEAPAA